MNSNETLVVLLEELRAARAEFSQQIRDLREETKASEQRLAGQLAELKGSVEKTEEKVEQLETRINKLGPSSFGGGDGKGTSLIARIAAGVATVVAAIFWAIINFKPPGG